MSAGAVNVLGLRFIATLLDLYRTYSTYTVLESKSDMVRFPSIKEILMLCKLFSSVFNLCTFYSRILFFKVGEKKQSRRDTNFKVSNLLHLHLFHLGKKNHKMKLVGDSITTSIKNSTMEFLFKSCWRYRNFTCVTGETAQAVEREMC